MSATRGCPYSCSFCSVTSLFGHAYRCRPVEEVLQEIETLNQKEFIVFVDDNIVGNPKFAEELFRALLPYKIKWVSQASVTVAKNGFSKAHCHTTATRHPDPTNSAIFRASRSRFACRFSSQKA
ncbi:radical SAM protein [Chloroflexota bacterium]